jgi:hypothetical protein
VSTEEPMSIEDRIRTATRAGATLVRDIGPMAAREPARLRRRPAPAARRWGPWGIPLAAAAAVVLVAVSLVAVRHFGASAPATSGPATSAPAAIPRYYVALDMAGTQSDGYTGTGNLIVGDDQTGKAIATVAPPHGVQWEAVRGASDDRTFIVQGVPKPTTPVTDRVPETWYLLRIALGTAHPYQLSKLPLKLPGSRPEGIDYALSPDGRELAVESFGDQARTLDTVTLALYSVSSGAELRAWTASKFTPSTAAGTLAWLSNGRELAFTDEQGASSVQVRTLDVLGSGTDLMTAGRVVLTLRSPSSSPSSCFSMQLTPDGGTVICGTQYAFVYGGPGTNAGCVNGGLEFTAYSVRTGKPVRVMYQYRAACRNGFSRVLWTNDSGTEIIGATQIDIANQGGKQTGQLGVITGGRISLLKLPKTVSPTYYGSVVF